MKKNRRRTLSLRLLALVLCLACVLGAAPLSAIATETESVPSEPTEVTPAPSEDTPTLTGLTEGTGDSTEGTGETTAPPTGETTGITGETTVPPTGETTEGTGETTVTPGNPETTGTETGTPTTDATGDPDSITPTETEAETEPVVDPVQELYDKLMACETLEEANAILLPESEEERKAVDALIEQFTEEQNAALEAKMNELGAYETETLESYTVTIPIGDRYSQYKGWDTSNINLSISGEEGFTVQGLYRSSGNYQGYAVRVGNSVVDGTYTVVVSYSGDKKGSDTWTIEVTSQNIEVGVYYLKSPTLQPSSNDVNDWGTAITLGYINKRGANYETAGSFTDKNCYSPTDWIIDMPAGLTMQDDGSYLVSKTELSNHWNTIWNAYKASWEEETGLTLTEDDVVGIYLTPYKLSQDNGDLRKKEQYEVDHIDCTVSVKLKNYYGVRFWVTKPGQERVLVDSKNYKTDESIAKTTEAPTNTTGGYPETFVYGGVTYVFDGWYNEAGTKVADANWPYTPNEKELTDGFVDFYAKYVPATYTLTVTKEISGNMLGNNDSFNFTVSGNVAEADKSFTLKAKEEKKITVTYGDTVTVTEATGSYTTTYKIGTGTAQDGNAATITVTSSQTITFINTQNITPETGIILDALPYVLILAIVAGGVVLMLLRRRRSYED